MQDPDRHQRRGKIFLAHLHEYFTDVERIAGYLREARETGKDHEALFARNQGEIEKLKAEMDRTYRLYQSDALSVEGFNEIYQPLERRVNELKAEQVRIQAEIDVKSARNLSAEVVADEARQLGQRWTDMDASEKRQIVEKHR